MLPVDLDKFWEDDEVAHEENCFSKKAPQVALGIGMSDECVFAELNEEAIIAEVKRDCEMAKAGDLRGLNLSTAGSINNGSSLLSMRTVMHAIQTYGRY